MPFLVLQLRGMVAAEAERIWISRCVGTFPLVVSF